MLFSLTTRYAVQPRDMGKNIDKDVSKNLSGKYSQKILIMLNSLPQMRLKLLQKEQFKKQQKQLVI